MHTPMIECGITVRENIAKSDQQIPIPDLIEPIRDALPAHAHGKDS
jgi:hypothetical protein